jgi:hypothetical protein
LGHAGGQPLKATQAAGKKKGLPFLPAWWEGRRNQEVLLGKQTTNNMVFQRQGYLGDR